MPATRKKTSSPKKSYAAKRSFDATPEPPPAVGGDVDPGRARPGKTFVIHQHHATRLHFDLRLEMLNGKVPVLVSWAVPKNLPLRKREPRLAVHVEDHPFEYGSFSGRIPEGNYGAGEVRIFDSGTYEVLKQEPGKLTFRLEGSRMQGVWHLFRTRGEKDWLVTLSELQRPDPEPLPQLSPMLATSATDPFDDERWIFEPKWDGVRALAVCAEDTMVLSRTGRDITATYPELARLHERLVALEAVVDGEIVAFTGGRPSFELLQSRINLHERHAIERASRTLPVSFMAFDLIYLDGRRVCDLPLEERKEMLEELVVPSDRVSVSTYVAGDGTALFDAARERGLEGIVAKKLKCPYRPGRRSRDWLKIKTTAIADVVIGGWTEGEGARSSSFGALLIGAYEGSDLRFAGAVGTGFSERVITELLPQLKERETDKCPFAEDPTGTRGGYFGKTIRHAHWTLPELVARVEFREVTQAGRLRAPSYKGLHTDKAAQDCLFEDLRM